MHLHVTVPCYLRRLFDSTKKLKNAWRMHYCTLSPRRAFSPVWLFFHFTVSHLPILQFSYSTYIYSQFAFSPIHLQIHLSPIRLQIHLFHIRLISHFPFLSIRQVFLPANLPFPYSFYPQLTFQSILNQNGKRRNGREYFRCVIRTQRSLYGFAHLLFPSSRIVINFTL
jgi:hypothetical protein